MKILQLVLVVGFVGVAGLSYADEKRGPTVYFELDSSEVTPGAKAELDAVAKWLKEDTNREILVEGHADDLGAPDYNWKLGESRAAQVKQYLVAQGVDPTAVVIVSRGETAASEGANPADRKVVMCATKRETRTVATAETPPPPPPAPEPEPEPTYAPPPPPDDDLVTPIGLGVTLGGGVLGMFDADTREFTNVGGTWEARMTVGTRVPVAFEGAYVGSAQTIDALGLDSDAMLMGNGLEGALRINFMTSSVQPYLFGGLGWTHYDVTNADVNTSSVQDQEDIFTTPLGLGCGFEIDGFLIDVRGTVRPAFDDDMIAETASGEEAGLDSWALTAKAGWEF